MNLTIFQIPALSDNIIHLVLCERTRAVAVVDPSEAEPVLDFLKKHDLQPQAIWITHHHPDHVGGNMALLERFPNLTVIGSAFNAQKRRIPGQNQIVSEGDVVTLGELSFETWDVPGHTHGHVAWIGHDAVFSGDTLFSAGCGRIFEGTLEDLYASVTRFATLPDACHVYCGHDYIQKNLEFALTLEPDNQDVQLYMNHVRQSRKHGQRERPSTIATEKACNPFFRLQSPRIREKIAGNSAFEIFAEMRRKKDQF